MTSAPSTTYGSHHYAYSGSKGSKGGSMGKHGGKGRGKHMY